MPVWLTIDARSGVPIYLQLVDQIRHALEVGILQPGDTLPTVRELAEELTVAPNTVVKAFSELQRLDLIRSRPGAGTVVTATPNGALRDGQVQALFERLHTLVRDAAALGVPAADLARRLETEIAAIYPTQEGAGGDGDSLAG